MTPVDCQWAKISHVPTSRERGRGGDQETQINDTKTETERRGKMGGKKGRKEGTRPALSRDEPLQVIQPKQSALNTYKQN